MGLTWCNAAIKSQVSKWEVMDLESLSNHNYICFEISLEYAKTRMSNHKKRYTRWAYKKMDVDRFKEALIWRSANHIHEDSVDKMDTWMQDAMIDACNYSMPVVVPVHKESVCW